MKKTTRTIVLLGVLTAIELILVMTPIGSIALPGGLKVTLGMLPVGVAAIALGPLGGVILGAVWGLASFVGCLGIGVGSGLLIATFGINPFFTFLLCFVPRVLDGFFTGLICRGCEKIMPPYPAFAVTGFCAAFLNTIIFLPTLVLFFGNTEPVQNLMVKFNVTGFFALMIAIAGVNAICEMVASTVFVSAIGIALHRAKLIEIPAAVKEA